MKTISETIDGSIKDIIQLKTVDNSLEYSQMFDALEDCPDSFKSKLIGALNSLSQTMGISPSETFNKVLCASDDENAKKKLYNWWKAVFEVVGKSEGNIPKDRLGEYEEKVDALVAEICKAGDKASGGDEEPIMESSKQFSDEEIMRLLDRYTQLYGWDIQDVRDALDGNISPGFRCAVEDALPVAGHPAYSELVNRMGPVMVEIVRKNGIYKESRKGQVNEGYEPADLEDEDKLKESMQFAISKLGEVANKAQELVNFLNPYCKADKFNEDNDMKKLNERGGSDWVSMDDIVGMEVGEADDGSQFWGDIDDMDRNDKKNMKKTFKVGDKVCWTDPDGGETTCGWEIVDFDDYGGGDELFTIARKDGTISEVYANELSPDTSEETDAESSGAPMDENVGMEVGESDDGSQFGKDLENRLLDDLANGEPLDEYEFIELMKDDDAGDVCTVYDGTPMEDGSVCLNVIVNKDDIDNEEVKAEYGDWVEQYGWRYDSFTFSSDLVGDEGTETINVYFRPIEKKVDESDLENELNAGDDGWKEIGQPVGEATVTVDANDVWDVLDLLDDETANKHLTDLINSHVRSEEEIMDAIDSCYPDGVRKGELNAYMKDSFYEIVDELGLDVEKFKRDGQFVEPEKPVTLEDGKGEEQKPDEVKDGDKKYKKDGETKTLVTGSEKKVVTEMTIEQEVDDPWKLVNLLWGQGKENFQELLDSNLFGDDTIMSTLEQFEIRNLGTLNDFLGFEFENFLEALGCDKEAWVQHLEITRA